MIRTRLAQATAVAALALGTLIWLPAAAATAAAAPAVQAAVSAPAVQAAGAQPTTASNPDSGTWG